MKNVYEVLRRPLITEKSTALKDSGQGHITEKGDPQEGPECKKK